MPIIHLLPCLRKLFSAIAAEARGCAGDENDLVGHGSLLGFELVRRSRVRGVGRGRSPTAPLFGATAEGDRRVRQFDQILDRRVVPHHHLREARDSPPRIGSFEQMDGVAGLHVSGRDHARIPARTAGADHGAPQPIVLEADAKLEARLTRLRHLKERSADAVDIADRDLTFVQTSSGQIFAEAAGVELAGTFGILTAPEDVMLER